MIGSALFDIAGFVPQSALKSRNYMEPQPPRLKPGKILDTLGAMQKSLTRASQRIAQ
ncbi:putative transcriptional regulator [Salmonella enterica subsp. enterica serovar Urbana str. R8-2977]|nr:putative transcriptional regulator [Salmonella enterica subsp. enterica serovar Urbana str. R8-2977]